MNELLAAGGMALLAITSVGLWTLRVALTARGRRTIGATVAAVEAVIFAVAFTNVAAHLDSPLRIAGYAAGVAFGTVLGLTADRRLSAGVSEVDIVVPGSDTDTAERLHRLGWPTTTLAARGPNGPVTADLRRRRRLPAHRAHNSCTSGSPRRLLDRPTPRHRTRISTPRRLPADRQPINRIDRLTEPSRMPSPVPVGRPCDRELPRQPRDGGESARSWWPASRHAWL